MKDRNNVHEFDYAYDTDHQRYRFGLLSDLHWDNPHCDRELLKSHLDYCKDQDIPVFLNGDTFCAMQGRYDGRRSRDDIREEHNVPNYLDALVQTAAEWFEPYASIIKVIGYGNHETSILKNCETDLIQRFADLLNARTKSTIQVGGYGGWIVLKWSHAAGGAGIGYKIKYFHGAGGGGPVTRGTIQNQRMLAQIQGADCIWMGHVHESYAMVNMVERLNKNNKVQLKEVLQVRTPTYKEEYADGYLGFHVERGRPPKPTGGYLLDLHIKHKTKKHPRQIVATAAPLIPESAVQ